MNEPSHVKAARALVDRPFQHRGRGPTYFDCLGVLVVAFAARGIVLRDRRTYGRNARLDGLAQELTEQFGPPVPGRPRVGDVGAFRFDGDWHHVGIFGAHPDGGLSLIHAYGRAQKVAEQAFVGSGWDKRLAAIFRHPDTVED